MDKAPDAFRTISEVADVLETPAHVLRFWETRFPQIKPVKRAGGRRYYRPADVALLAGIRHLLHAEGLTIRGAQKVLRDQGVRFVAALGGDISDLELDAEADFDPEAVAQAPVAQILPLTGVPRKATKPAPAKPATAAAVQPLFPAAPAPVNPDPARGIPASDATSDPSIPRDGGGGFIAFSSAPRSRPQASEPPNPQPNNLPNPQMNPPLNRPPNPPPAQASLPFDTQVPEAPHIWVEPDSATGTLTLHPASAIAKPRDPADSAGPDATPDTADAGPNANATPDTAPDSAGTPDATPDTAATPDATPDTAATPDATPDTAGPPDAGLAVDPSPDPVRDTQLGTRPDADLGTDPGADPGTESGTDTAVAPHAEADLSEAAPAQPGLAGLATRLRALKAPLTPGAAPMLAELHSRLGLLHAQMAEALRLRR